MHGRAFYICLNIYLKIIMNVHFKRNIRHSEEPPPRPPSVALQPPSLSLISLLSPHFFSLITQI